MVNNTPNVQRLDLKEKTTNLAERKKLIFYSIWALYKVGSKAL